jgi:hypothetical protein
MRKLVVLLTALVLGLLGAACSSDVGSCVASPDAAVDTNAAPAVDAPAAQRDSALPAVDAPQIADAAVPDDGGVALDGGQGDDATPAEADSGSD